MVIPEMEWRFPSKPGMEVSTLTEKLFKSYNSNNSLIRLGRFSEFFVDWSDGGNDFPDSMGLYRRGVHGHLNLQIIIE